MKTIAFTVYQRPFYLRPVLEQWRKVRGIKDWRVEFHIDPSIQTSAQVKVVSEFLDWHPHASAHMHDDRLGVLKNPLHALSEAFQTSEYVVLAEEDVEVSTDVLEYFDFAQSQPVLAACAWSDRDDDPNLCDTRKWFNPWCWGTSRSMFHEVIEPTWDTDYSTGDERGPGGWDCNLGLRVVHDLGHEVLFPGVSRSRHVGKYLGQHQDPRAFGETEMPQGFALEREPKTWDLRS